MGNKSTFIASDGSIDEERKSSEQLANGKSRVKSIGSGVLPGNLSRIVGDYLPENKRYYVEAALVGVQPITLCLSQDVKTQLGYSWPMGFLPPERQWKSLNVKADKEYLIKDLEGCLLFLNPKQPNYCPIDIEVLVVKLGMTTSNSPNALLDLRNTLTALQSHLKSVKHVVISISEYVSCCFTFNHAIDKKVEVHQPIDRWKMLTEILDDLDTCWKNSHTLTAYGLIDFYFNEDVTPATEKYLAKFVISLNHPLARGLFKEEASHIVTNKIMWVCFLMTPDDFNLVEQNTSCLCRVHFMDASAQRISMFPLLKARLDPMFCFHNNPFIERIVIHGLHSGLELQLPRPSMPLTDATPLSALIQLTLEGKDYVFHLTHLNSGYFPRLTHLSVVGGQITGHLDSSRVPCLKTLIIEPGDHTHFGVDTLRTLIPECVQSLIHAGRPWQFVTTHASGGWSLASYDESTPNPQDDVKDGIPLSNASPCVLPIIKELILVMSKQEDANEWLLQLKGNPSLEATAGDHSDHLLTWSPQCVQKITVFSTVGRGVRFDLSETIPGQIRLVNSLTCHDISVVLDGAVLPHLQTLEVNYAYVYLSGAFRQLKVLSLEEVYLKTPWELDAPLLHSFNYRSRNLGERLCIRPHLLPHLSFLRIVAWSDTFSRCPEILVDEDSLGLSRVKHVVLCKTMTVSPFFNQFQVNNVPHLLLCVNPLHLPACWFHAVWQCETLILYIYASTPENLHAEKTSAVMKLPPLPQVKALTVISRGYPVLLDTKLPNLTECTVPSPRSLGKNLWCPSLKLIRFTDPPSESDSKNYLNPATYVTTGAQPRYYL